MMESIHSLFAETPKNLLPMTIKNDWYPVCFHSKLDYRKWQYYRRGSGERVTVCDDCSDEYQKKMKGENRCFIAEAMRRSKYV
jgi:hypothetical protein